MISSRYFFHRQRGIDIQRKWTLIKNGLILRSFDKILVLEDHDNVSKKKTRATR